MMVIEQKVQDAFGKMSENLIGQIVLDIENDNVRWISDTVCEWKSLIIECDGPEGRISTIKIKEIL